MKKILSLFLLFLVGCANVDFPFCCDQTGVSDVPYTTTYLYSYKSGFSDVGGDLSILSIISQGDLANLFNAANVSRVLGTGVVGGHLIPVFGNDPSNMILEATDPDGNRIGDLFYNSLGGIPDFSTTTGSSVSGGFTLLNSPPGEVYLRVVQGGRGKTSLFAFADSVSLIDMAVVPVIPPFVGVTGAVSEYETNRAVGTGIATPLGIKGLSVPLAGGHYRFPSLESDSQFLVKASSSGDLDTYQNLSTDLNARPQGAVDVTLALSLLSESDRQKWFNQIKISGEPGTSTYDASLGVLIGTARDPDGTARKFSFVKVTNDQGSSLGTVFHEGVYFPCPNNIYPCNSPGNTPDKRHPKPTYFWFTDTAGTQFNFIDESGVIQPRVGASSVPYDCTQDPTKTCPPSSVGETNGSFIAFNLPAGSVHLSVQATGESDQGLVYFAGGESVDIFPGSPSVGSASLKDVLMNPMDLGKSNIYQDFKGNVTGSDGKSVVSFASIFALGNGLSLTTTDINGKIQVPASSGVYLDQSSYTFRVSQPLFMDTYQEVKIDNLPKNLKIYSSQVFNQLLAAAGLASHYDPTNGTLTGMILDNQIGRGTGGFTIKSTDYLGNSVGEIRYFDSFGLPTLNNASSKNGKYIIFNLPPGLIQVRVVSKDDSGNQWVHIYPNSVTLADLHGNKGPTPLVQVSGVTKDLYGSSGISADLSIRGEKTRLSSAGDGTFALPISSYSHEVVKSVANATDSLDTYNLFDTLSSDISQITLWALTKTTVGSQVQNESFAVDYSKGILGGKVASTGFSSAVQASTYQSSSVNDINQQRMTDGLFDEDNEVDIALVNSPDNTLTILLGGGDGTFSESPSSPYCLPLGTLIQPCSTGANPVSVRAIDLNKDGIPDLIVANKGTDSITVMMGTGKGNFEPLSPCSPPASNPLCLPAGAAPVAISVGDFNNDQNIDMIVLGSNNTFYTILGNGDGTFGSVYAFGIGGSSLSTPIAILSRDFNGDGNPDLAILTQDPNYPVRIFLGIGNGAFVAAPNSPIPAGSNPVSMASDDINGDGLLDLVIANQGSGTLTVLLGSGGGTFRQASTISLLPFYPEIVVLNDINFDGKPDILVTTTSPSGDLLHLVGKGDGTFGSGTFYPVGGSPSNLLAADFNDDFFSDLLVFQKNSGGFGKLSFLPGTVVPLSGVTLETLNLNGTPVGDLRYLDSSGNILNQTQTDLSGRFMVYNVPPGTINVHAVNGASGNRFMTAYAGGATFGEVAAIPPHASDIQYRGTTGDIVGDQVVRTVGNVHVSLLGTGVPPAISDSTLGAFSFQVNANNFLFFKLQK